MEEKEERYDEKSGQLRLVSVLDYLVILAKYKRLILRSVGASLLLAVVLLYLVIPRWYKSTATVMPPKQKANLGMLSAISRATAPLRSLGLGATTDDLADLRTILASRRVMEAVVDSFDLKKVYDLDTLEKTIKELEGNVDVSLGKEDVSIEISVFDTDAKRAAGMANFFVAILNKVYLEMSVAEARGNRVFLEKRYFQNLHDLAAAEDTFKVFQQRYGVYSVPDQVKAAVEGAATLEARIALTEVQLGILSKTTTEDNPARQAAQLELQELHRRIAEMKYGGSNKKEQSSVFPPFVKAPEIGLEYVRRFREIELQGKLLELILPLYEQAKIEEQRNTPSVIVLDYAVPAVKASKPKRLVILILVLIGSFVVTYMVAFALEALKRMKSRQTEADEEKILLVQKELRWKNLLR